MRVIGTAGHVDHGKSTLVQALTGVHPDRLKEEREREMTIDLGFAFLTLPDGEEVGIVDVPGHRDFIENMLSGVGGIDAALFVVAADEGVMPQTREHLAILDLLQINGGVVALTKTDLVPDEEWLDMVEEELRIGLAGTVLADAPIVRVSARTGEGVAAVQAAVQACLQERPPRPDLGRPRLPVDRVFTIAGFGTVVTGTLTDGRFNVGDEISILPEGRKGRVRGLQSHNRTERTAPPGARTAINLSGVDVDEVTRGSWIARPGDYTATRRLDLRFTQLLDISQPVVHNMEVKLFIGAAETIARLRLLGTETLDPGETGFIQLELRSPIVAIRGDRYILRRPSPGETIGGGTVIDAFPKGRHRRFNARLLHHLEALTRGTPEDILLQVLNTGGLMVTKNLAARAELAEDEFKDALGALIISGQVVPLTAPNAGGAEDALLRPDSLLASQVFLNVLSDRMAGELGAYHKAYPLRRGMAREELKSRLKLDARPFTLVVAALLGRGDLAGDQVRLWLPGHTIQFTAQQEGQMKGLLAEMGASPFSPPSVKDIQAKVGGEMYGALLELGELTQVSAEVAFRAEDYQGMLAGVRQKIEQDGSITVGDFRDQYQTSRKYALALLEHLDEIGVTARRGDARILR